MTKKRMLLKDIAEAVGVSPSAVSLVLNGKGRIGPEKQRAIRDLLRQAGHKPKSFRYPVCYVASEGTMDDIGISPQFCHRMAGFNAELHDQNIGFRTEFLRFGEGIPLEPQLHTILASRPGAIIVDDFREHCEEICAYFEKAHVPVVQIGFLARSPTHDACVIDNFTGGYDAAQYFLRKGHRNIGTIRWNVDGDPAGNQKFAGFCCALQEAGISIPESNVVPCGVSRTEHLVIPGREAAMQLTRLEKPPTAVFVENSYVSPALLYLIIEIEQQVPEEIRQLDMIHFEAWDLSNLRQIFLGKLACRIPPTKLLRINWEELARMAATRVVSRILDPTLPYGEVAKLAPRLIDW